MNYYEVEPEKNTFSDVVVDITHRCNMVCKNCYIPNRHIPDMDIDRLIEAISKFPKRTMIRIIGAEPTVRKDLPEIISRINSTKHRCTLLTNGLKLADLDYVKSLKSAGLRHIYISMNGIDNDDWYMAIDNMKCAEKKVAAIKNCHNSKMIIDVGVIMVKGINDTVPKELLRFFKEHDIKNVMCRIKNVGQLGRYMVGSNDNYSMLELMELISTQTGLSMDYLNEWRQKPIYENIDLEEDTFMFPITPRKEKKLVHRSGIWFKIADWDRQNFQKIPFMNQIRRGRITEDFKIAPFFEHVAKNEGNY